MFGGDTRTKALTDGVNGITTEYNSVTDAFEATINQLLDKNAADAKAVKSLLEIKSQIAVSRERVAWLQAGVMDVVKTSGLDDVTKKQLLDLIVSLRNPNAKTKPTP